MRIIKLILLSLTLGFAANTFAQSDTIERIVMIRHGEKPPVEIGQLDCQGLNRSLLLPAYFAKNFPHPDYIFAPNPSMQIAKNDKKFSYIRPLATIEPTAISLDLPVNTQIGFWLPPQDLLLKTLLTPQYHNALIYVAWEHINIITFANDILQYFNMPTSVPAWPENDYNTVFVFTIDWTTHTIVFSTTSEGLNNISNICPKG